jgi:molybdenum cofactor cytidylyltransferase
MPVAAIILAAGASRRLRQPKQLLAYRGETLLQRAIRLAQEAGATPVIAVLGANADIIKDSIARSLAIPVLNEDWEKGIASSIHTGLRAMGVVAPQTLGVLIMGCDQPRLTADHLRLLIDRFRRHDKPTIVASTYAGVSGVPAVFPQLAFPELLALGGDKGARALIADAPCPVATLEFDGGEVDIDAPEDIAQLE